MPTSSILLPIGAGTPPDGSSGNAAPAIQRVQGTESNPKKHFLVAAFDSATQEFLWFNFRMPADYSSGGVVKIHWYTGATSGNVVLAARLGAVTPADADTPIEHAQAAASTTTTAANGTEANRLIETSITLSNLDSVVAGDDVELCVYRDASNGSDTINSNDIFIKNISFEYTS